MASCPLMHNNNGNPQILPSEEESPYSTPIFRPMPRRTSSFSSSSESSFGSSSFSCIEDLQPFSPSTPLKKVKGVPFSWEQLPGIPKHKDYKNNDNSGHLLPLPPATKTYSTANKREKQDKISPKKHHSSRFERDPFLTALVECSKDDGHDRGNMWKVSSKVTRSLSDRFGIMSMYTSCKTTCVVSESLVYLPRSNPHSILNRRSS